ncbi:selenocysteine-specific translation elongation factor [Wansuia hejianensis]|uniref:Selenocysteine-specific elongation factor n=1 Tax=Wansuia hejianensis TaxID=2763667 RepID=A0A926IHL4_9FIRM|nr:selenocysteine-specific translation elongation factor [Wansuia hejianensis]MBC8590802.1 selenocysteine-specific translation elongation factor [Wansuia hejianensis]
MKHIIVGTAGHIDHGKTTLIRALTGKNTDRLKEEQKRGISIELGFTYFDLPNGQRAGIIDVPGHEKFIKNMLAGVIGIDIVLLVVAADEGIMPQTAEHLAILDLVGIEKGFVVLTKTDLVDEEWIELVEEEVKEEVKGTFLENSPLIRVSSTKKEGVDEVKKLIESYSEEVKEKRSDEMPRLPVDRAFIMSGFGTIVTGTLLSGALKIGQEVQIFPGNKIGRIRTLQVHDQEAEVAYAGQRVAMNLAGIKKDEVDRGSVIAPVGSMKESILLDVKVRLLGSIDRPIKNRTRLKLYLGTKEVLCRIILLDREELEPGEEAYAQLRLEEEIVAKRQDKFVIRFYSPMFTIGGGEILEPNARKRKRFDKDSLKELEIKSQGSSIEIIEKIIEDKSKDFPSIKDLSLSTSMLEENLMKDIQTLSEDKKILTFSLTKDVFVIHINYFEALKDKVLNELKVYHERFPLRIGMGKEEIRNKVFKKAKPRLAELIMDTFVKKGYLEQEMEYIKIKGFQIQYNREQNKIKDRIINKLKRYSFTPPKKDELSIEVGGNSEEFVEVLNSLINKGDIIRLNEEIFLLKETYMDGLNRLRNFIEKNGAITVAQYRDILNTNRKISVALLEYFDQQKITKRYDDKRILIKN